MPNAKKAHYACLLLMNLVLCSLTFAQQESVSNNETPTATLVDTYKFKRKGSGYFFIVSEINNEQVKQSSISWTAGASAGQGAKLNFRSFSREVAAGETALTIKATEYHNVPLLNFGKKKSIEGTVRFHLDPGGYYFVNGYISDNYAAVWLENSEGDQVSTIFEDYATEEDKKTALKGKNLKALAELKARNTFLLHRGAKASALIKAYGQPDAKDHLNDKEIRHYYYGKAIAILSNSANEQGTIKNITFSPHPYSSPETLKELLLSDDIQVIRTVVKDILTTGENRITYLDQLPPLAWRIKNFEHGSTVDTVTLLGLALANDTSGRYYHFIDKLSKEISHKRKKSKLIKATETLNKNAKNSYSLAEIEKSADEFFPNNSYPILPGASLAMLENRFGKANTIESKNDDKSTHHYFGRASIKTRTDKKSNQIVSEVFILDPQYTTPSSLEKLLKEGSGLDIRNLVINMVRTMDFRSEYLDKFPLFAWQLRTTENPLYVDLISHICKLLAKEPSGRYYQFLQSLSKENIHKKIKNHVNKALKVVNKKNPNPFPIEQLN